jgi:hypothetical protein
VDFGNRPTFSSRQSVVWPTGTISSTIFSFNMRRGSSGAATGVSCKELFESTMGPKRSAIARPVVWRSWEVFGPRRLSLSNHGLAARHGPFSASVNANFVADQQRTICSLQRNCALQFTSCAARSYVARRGVGLGPTEPQCANACGFFNGAPV